MLKSAVITLKHFHFYRIVTFCLSQVYIVGMTGNETVSSPTSSEPSKEDGDDREFGEFESRGESLLTLVQPELVSLSKHWLAALKDHALLSLPPGMQSHLD